jgi:hypothetical protein
MPSLLLGLYFTNALLLIIHEIDSAYWKEWDLFSLKGGINVFLLLHFPMVFIVLYGLLQIYQQTLAGLVLALFLGLTGIFAFSIHMYFLRKGRPEFNTPLSVFILITIFLVSLAQLGTTLYYLSAR